ncbi:filamentous hemagglutinin N-terminal domain-containing protein [Caenimonas sedimenti]|uniref:Filamentous hemagglutinin N-terminal domain-containing protein n=1 Tax=Caenimonas sedimenti TaxID=2596921 RepID=A0A562ZMH6_9BURK|nr:filamentous hemagglutinin N-terminal domain-containing protein [Caenimonas sedimenti]TWO69792.1 filamentous hemagglutinin N-terminal domain-containing protein [Caenimonas sedimenti]
MTAMRPRLLPLSLAVLALLGPLVAGAQVRTDGSVGAARNLSGPTYAITEDLGRRVGTNLFHSFDTFRIGGGETALFSTATPAIANVFGRVTGGQVSTIDGTIRLKAAAGVPALFLINPAGIVFGAGAAIDVPGAFYASTADSIRFPDGAFNADPARASTFSSAPPEAFGFLGERHGSVELRGAQLTNGDAPLSIVAGDVTLRDAASVRNRGGKLKAVAVGQQAVTIPLTGDPGLLRGRLRIEPGSSLQTESRADIAGGAIRVAAGRVEAEGATEGAVTGIRSTAQVTGTGGAVSVRADESLVLSHGAEIGSAAHGSGAAGRVQVAAGSLLMDAVDGDASVTSIRSLATASGASGDVTVHIAGDARLRGALIGTEASGEAGFAGPVRLTAKHLWLEDRARIQAYADSGRGGALAISAENLTVARSRIVSFSEVPVAVDVTVQDTLRIQDGASISTYSGGPLRVQARQVLLDNGSLESYAIGSVDAAGLTVTASEAVELLNGSTIETIFLSAGSSGPLKLTAGRLLVDASEIRSRAETSARGGDVLVSVAGGAELRNNGRLATETIGSTGSGLDHNAGGSITLRAKSLSLRGGLLEGINDSVHGRGGDVTLDVEEKLLVADDGSGAFAGIRVVREGDGPMAQGATAGSVVIRAGELVLDGQLDQPSDEYPLNTGIYTSSWRGRAGKLDIEARGPVLLRNAFVVSEGVYGGNSGAISLKSGTSVVLEESDISTASRAITETRVSRGGDISVEAPEIHLSGKERGSSIISDGSVSSGLGGGGRIRLRASGPITLRGDAIIGSFVRELGLFDANDGAAGNIGVDIQAGSLLLDATSADHRAYITSRTTAGTNDRARDLVLRIGGPIELHHGAYISTTTLGLGNAGDLSIDAGSLLIDTHGSGRGGVLSESVHAFFDGFVAGNAGSVVIRLAGDLAVRGGSRISSSAVQGAAGAVQVNAANIRLTGVYDGPMECGECLFGSSSISASVVALPDPLNTPASGQSGNVSVTAAQSIVVADGALINMQNSATVKDPALPSRGTLRLSAPRIEVRGNNASVNAASTGNVAASDIQIEAGSLVTVQNGRIITSATGSAGNGGSIRITAPVMALETGFVQANATAAGAAGGNIFMDVRALLSSHESLRVGGDTVAVFEANRVGGNVIQAAAPTGISGSIAIAAPQLDLVGALTPMAGDTLPAEPLGKSPCRRTGGSALGIAGRGGLALSATDPVGSQLGQAVSTSAGASVVRLAGRTGCAGSR